MEDNLLDLVIVHRLAARYCEVAGLYMYGVNKDGEIFSEITGEPDECKRLIELVGKDTLDNLYHRVSDSDMEVQAMEDTVVPNIRIAASAMFVGGEAVMTWIFIGVLNDDELNVPGAVGADQFSRIISFENFMHSVDIVRDVTQLIMSSTLSMVSAEAESRRSKFSEQEMKDSLERAEAVSRIVQLLDSDEAIEAIMSTCMGLIGEYLNISTAMVARTRQGKETMDILAEWTNSGVVSLFDRFRDQKTFSFLKSDKPIVISYDSDVPAQLSKDMAYLGIKALVVLPIHVVNGYGMYACFMDKSEEKKFSVDEVKFLHDASHVLHSVVTKRIQKNSLAGSYASLESLLDNVGSAIYVRDVNTNTPLFMNRILKSTFATELQNNTLDELFDSAIPVNRGSGIYEINHIDRNRWYDLHYTYINWVDGRKVSLCAAYDVTDKKTYQKRIEQQACTDFLTGLYNRMCCERDLAIHIDSAKRNNMTGALLYLDLDDFKHINDGLGHQYGDVLLKAISHSLQRIDGIQNTCYRMGGDEFVIIIPPESFDRRNHIVAEIKDIFAKPWFLKDADYYCTMSMGMVEFPENGTGVHDLIKKADIAMYEAKKSGKNRMAVYSDNIDSASHQRLDMEKNMRDATTGGFREFEVYYQPIIDIKKPGTPCTGAEALIRWNSQEMGFISPGEFIPLAEYLGLINPIGNYVLMDACNTCRRWNDCGYPGYRVNVNLSVVQLLQTDIVEIVEKTLKESGINPHNLTLEVTESLAINDMERMKKILGDIKALGVRIALDDFGTGYSSLNHIREIPFDVIKVDQTFIKDLETDSYAGSFVKMVGELAEAIGVNVCVEGVETEQQLNIIKDMPVDLIQGYYYDKPMTQEAFEKKYLPNMH